MASGKPSTSAKKSAKKASKSAKRTGAAPRGRACGCSRSFEEAVSRRCAACARRYEDDGCPCCHTTAVVQTGDVAFIEGVMSDVLREGVADDHCACMFADADVSMLGWFIDTEAGKREFGEMPGVLGSNRLVYFACLMKNVDNVEFLMQKCGTVPDLADFNALLDDDSRVPWRKAGHASYAAVEERALEVMRRMRSKGYIFTEDHLRLVMRRDNFLKMTKFLVEECRIDVNHDAWMETVTHTNADVARYLAQRADERGTPYDMQEVLEIVEAIDAGGESFDVVYESVTYHFSFHYDGDENTEDAEDEAMKENLTRARIRQGTQALRKLATENLCKTNEAKKKIIADIMLQLHAHAEEIPQSTYIKMAGYLATEHERYSTPRQL